MFDVAENALPLRLLLIFRRDPEFKIPKHAPGQQPGPVPSCFEQRAQPGRALADHLRVLNGVKKGESLHVLGTRLKEGPQVLLGLRGVPPLRMLRKFDDGQVRPREIGVLLDQLLKHLLSLVRVERTGQPGFQEAVQGIVRPGAVEGEGAVVFLRQVEGSAKGVLVPAMDKDVARVLLEQRSKGRHASLVRDPEVVQVRQTIERLPDFRARLTRIRSGSGCRRNSETG